MEKEKCDKGWKDGSCCCNCKNQIEIFKHPWNNNPLFKGSCTESTSLYLCTVEHDMEKNRKGIIFEFEHSMCELHEFKD